MERVVVAGGSGLVGRMLVAALAGEGYEVVVLTRSPERASRGLPALARAVAWDGRSADDWTGELVGALGVVQLAGASTGKRWTRKRKAAIRRSRLDSTGALVDAMAALPEDRRPRVLVSSAGIDYSGDTGEQTVDEETSPGDSFLAGVVVDWEAAAQRAAEHGVRVATLRTSFVVARGAPALKPLTRPFRLFLGGPYGNGRQWFPWVHVDDVAGLFLLALRDERLSGPVNVAAPGIVREREFAKEVGRVLHRPSWLPAPRFAMRLMIGEMADLVLHSHRAVPCKALAAGYEFRYPELRAALADALG